LDAGTMTRQVDAFVGTPRTGASAAQPESDAGSVAEFVCEEDVRQAVKLGRTIVVGERTIITPAARDLASAHRVFVSATWPR
jgi:hypothetical protein